MARQLAVAVGVSKVRGLPLLAGVRTGVEEFEAWARSQEFEVVRIDDDGGAGAVSANDIFKLVRKAVRDGDVERLFVFFAGHGFASGAGDDLWLCSEADSDPADAVNVAKSASLARRCGIGHVVFFADACRTPKNKDFNELAGRSIFPSERVENMRTEVDQFYATVSGDEAFELQPAQAEKAFGIFSRCLLDALSGQEPGLLSPVDNGRAPFAVLARPLGNYLYETVRKRSATDLHITQTPDCVPTSDWEPNALAWFADVEAEAEAEQPPPPIGGPGPWLLPPPQDERREVVDAIASRMAAEPGRTHFETGVGASIIGAELLDARLTDGHQGMFPEDGNWQVRGYSGRACALLALVLVPNRSSLWLGTAVYPGFVTTVTVGDQGADHVATVSVSGNIDADRQALAWADASFRAGSLGFVEDEEVQRLVSEANPTMSVLAAYAYDRAGRDDEVQRILEICTAANWPVPFDVAMLAESQLDPARVVPHFPLMTRGWALADDLPSGAKWLTYGKAQLARSAWTTFRELSSDAVGVYERLTRGTTP